MVALKRKKVELVGEKTSRGIISFPRFFIKALSGNFSIYHRLTHSYLESVNTEEELVAKIGEWEAKTEDELWYALLTTRGFSINNLTGVMRNKIFEQDEDWYFGAWGVYTTTFYEKYPHLFTEVNAVPNQIINRVRLEISENQSRMHEKHKVEVERAEQQYKTGVGVSAHSPKEEIVVPSIRKEEEPKHISATPPPKKKVKRIIRLPKPVNPFD